MKQEIEERMEKNMTITINPEIERVASQICKAYGLDLNGYVNISISRLIEENKIPFDLNPEESFYQLKPEVQEGILWANAHRDELPTFDSLEEMYAWIDSEDDDE